MKSEDLLKKIYHRAVEKREQHIDVVVTGNRPQHDQAQAVTPAGRARVQAIAAAMQQQKQEKKQEKILQQSAVSSSTESSIPHSQAEPATADPASADPDSAVPAVAHQVNATTDRDALMGELINVYRDKRHIIDDLPPKHRQLLEKMGKIILGADSKRSKQH